mgnify:CR=1 FL=1
MKIRKLMALTLVFIGTNAARAEDNSWLHGTWDSVEFWGSNQLPTNATITFEFRPDGICVSTAGLGGTNKMVCEGAYSVTNGVITYRKDAENVANLVYSISNSFLIVHDDQGWDSWMKFKKR